MCKEYHAYSVVESLYSDCLSVTWILLFYASLVFTLISILQSTFTVTICLRKYTVLAFVLAVVNCCLCQHRVSNELCKWSLRITCFVKCISRHVSVINILRLKFSHGLHNRILKSNMKCANNCIII